MEALGDEALWNKTENSIAEIVENMHNEGAIPAAVDQEALIKDVLNEALGLGPLEDLLAEEPSAAATPVASSETPALDPEAVAAQPEPTPAEVEAAIANDSELGEQPASPAPVESAPVPDEAELFDVQEEAPPKDSPPA